MQIELKCACKLKAMSLNKMVQATPERRIGANCIAMWIFVFFNQHLDCPSVVNPSSATVLRAGCDRFLTNAMSYFHPPNSATDSGLGQPGSLASSRSASSGTDLQHESVWRVDEDGGVFPRRRLQAELGIRRLGVVGEGDGAGQLAIVQNLLVVLSQVDVALRLELESALP